jgi:hypothetical protein
LRARPGAKRVNSFATTLIVALMTFMSGLLGFFVQWQSPAQHVLETNEVMGSIVGLAILLLALVLGLLILMSYRLYTGQNGDSQSLGPLVLKLDSILDQYGADASRGRELLRASLMRARDRFWGRAGRAGSVAPYAQARADLQDMTSFFATLEPTTDRQKQIIAEAMPIFMQIVETTLLMTRRLANRTPKLLTFMIIGWATLLFFCCGLLGAFNGLGLAVLALGSIAVSGAIFLILEFNQPYSGLIRISPVGVDNLIAALSP